MIEHGPADSSELNFLRNRVAELEAAATDLGRDYVHLKRLFERAPMAYQSLDENGCFLAVNQAWLDTLGYSRNEVIGRNFGEFLHPDWQNHFLMNFPRFKAIGEVLGVEFEMARKDGSFLLVSFDGKISRNSQGLFQQTHCIFQDITERRRAEMALLEKELILNVSQRLTKAGGWQWDVIAQTMTWTEQTHRIHDLEPDKFSRSSPDYVDISLACYAPEDRPRILAAFRRCAETGEPYDLEFPFTTAKGRRLWIRTTAEAVWLDGRIVKVIGNLVDITEQKQNELRLLENEQALQAILNASPESIFLMTADGTVTAANVLWPTA